MIFNRWFGTFLLSIDADLAARARAKKAARTAAKYGHLNPTRFDQWVSNSAVGAVWPQGAPDIQGTDDKKAAGGGF
ncbi:hypothetical protein M0D69_02650 [Caballeronia sp. SEWSISQ10-4 2]|uniref:hypothetical protein n=1 Tax=Caballeronia sp. SEWSISQ10-4 2 TaxID=2937438 RepID=UPI002651FDCA|nr:hypothetical protein [Caballeronia sp. SEWSISQ10-4 2]MDN7176937.1 hypothetical protein [Caballeronia sp. SEWSISQ10-4 2]